MEAGPRSELAYWRSRVSALSILGDKLRSKESLAVVGIASAARSKVHKEWKLVEAKVCFYCVW